MCLLPLEFEPTAKRDNIIGPRITCRDPIALHTQVKDCLPWINSHLDIFIEPRITCFGNPLLYIPPPSKRLPPLGKLPLDIFMNPRITCFGNPLLYIPPPSKRLPPWVNSLWTVIRAQEKPVWEPIALHIPSKRLPP